MALGGHSRKRCDVSTLEQLVIDQRQIERIILERHVINSLETFDRTYAQLSLTKRGRLTTSCFDIFSLTKTHVATIVFR